MAGTVLARARRLEVFSMKFLSPAEGSHRRGLAKVLSWTDTQSDMEWQRSGRSPSTPPWAIPN